jgi:hypothetical protein
MAKFREEGYEENEIIFMEILEAIISLERACLLTRSASGINGNNDSTIIQGTRCAVDDK